MTKRSRASRAATTRLTASNQPNTNRRWKNCFSLWLYRHRNAIERMFGHLKDFSPHRNPLRPTRSQLPRCGLPRRYPLLLVMSLGPRRFLRSRYCPELLQAVAVSLDDILDIPDGDDAPMLQKDTAIAPDLKKVEVVRGQHQDA